MPKTLTTSDRSHLIRLASTMPVGTPERKAILAGLTKVARDTVAEEVAAKLSRHIPGSKVFALSGAGKVGVDLPGYAETGRKDNFAHVGVMNDSISVKQRSSTPLPNPFLPGQDDPHQRDEIVIFTDRGRKQVFSFAWGGSADKAARDIAKRLLKGKKASASLKDVLRKWPEFAPEIQKELRGLRAALRGDPDFGRVSNALMQIQMRLEDDHRRDPAAFHARAPFNKALADFAKAEYQHKTGNKW